MYLFSNEPKKICSPVVLAICWAIFNIPLAAQGQTDGELEKETKNTVIVMGMIHGGHRQPGPFDIENLKGLVRKIKPDFILTEIPPDRLGQATKQFRESGEITEKRVRVFPEYVDAIFPLTKEMDFEIIPCAAWTTSMNDRRRETLKKLRTTHKSQYAEMEEAQKKVDENVAAIGSPNDPVVIHTQSYDKFVKQGMEPYDRYFNDLIGVGGWSNINAAHYALIDKALDDHSGKGKRFLITFGAWHKYYIKEQLNKRTDIQLVSMSNFLKQSSALNPTPVAWPRFRLDRNASNAYGTTEIKKPKSVWSFDTGEIVESSPIVVGEVVFVGGHAKRLHAIDRKSGKLKWKFDVGGWVRGTPSVVDGVVYFGADDNKFYALDAKTGEKKWQFELGEGGEQSSPSIENGVIYFGAFDNHVYALEAKTGKQIWKFDAGASMLSSPFLNDDSLFIGTYKGKVFSIDRKTGKKNWEFQENESPVFSSPVASGDVVVFTSYDQHAYAVKIEDGSIVWKYKTKGQIFSSPALLGEKVYFGSNDNHLYAVSLSDGKEIWKTDLSGAVFSSPAVTENSIYVGSSDGHLYALDRKDGKQRWKYLVGDQVKVWTSPVAIQGTIYFGSHKGEIIALTDEN